MDNIQLAQRVISIAGIQNEQLCIFLQKSIRHQEKKQKKKPKNSREIQTAQAKLLLAMISPP